ncbi:MAG: type 4a pilus biogenesis protein PilO [Acidobacteriota bacterium]
MASGFQTGLEGKPWYVAAAVAVLIAGAVVGATHFLKLEDIRNNIKKEEKKLAKLQKKIDEGRSAQRSLPQFREEVGRLELELDKLLRVLPSRRNTEDLLRRVRTLTEQGDFKLLRFTPRRRSDRGFYYEWPIQIRLDGTYHNLALFFDRVSQFSRIINIEGLRVNSKRGKNAGSHTISANFTMKTYLYIEQEPEDEEDG